MLSKRYRLKSPSLFRKTLDTKRIFATPALCVFVLRRRYPGDKPARFGIVISKKVHKRAYRRNKIKRRIREILRRKIIVNCKRTLSPYIAVVVLARTGAVEATFQQLEQDLYRAFTRLEASSTAPDPQRPVNNRPFNRSIPASQS